MEVLKEGTKTVVVCEKCGSTLRYSDSDVKLAHQPQGYVSDEGEVEDRYRLVVYCPVCPNRTQISVYRNTTLIRQLMARARGDDIYH
jgi:ribosomal protein S27E